MRDLILAFQFLTRLPMPALIDVQKQELASASVYFPVVGLSIGALLALAAMLGVYASPWLGGLLVVLMWIAVTGALHLDGAADLADALGASHAHIDDDSERFLAVLKDPHVGSFAVVVLLAIVLSKLVAVAVLLEAGAPFLLLIVIPAWARLGALYWGQTLKSLAPGHGESFSEKPLQRSMWFWAAALFVVTALLLPFWFAVLAMFSVFLWGVFLQRRIGGMTGDCLGAGIEYCECAMLLVAIFIF